MNFEASSTASQAIVFRQVASADKATVMSIEGEVADDGDGNWDRDDGDVDGSTLVMEPWWCWIPWKKHVRPEK